MKRKKLSCIALLLLMFFTISIVAESASVVAAPIIGRWQFDEGIGSITLDSSGQEKTGTISSATWVEGIMDRALKFLGTGSHVQVPSSNLVNLSRWSLTAFVMPTGTKEMCVYSEKDSKGNPNLTINITTDNRIKVMRAGTVIGDTARNAVKRDEWNNIVVAYEDGVVKCYVSGTTTQIVVRRVSLNKTNLWLVPDETTTLVATIFPANATNQNVIWSSSNTSIATVNQKGVVTGRAPGGEAIITVTTEDGGYTATCRVLVAPVGASWTVGSSTGLTRLDGAVERAAGVGFNNIAPWSGIKQETRSGQTMIRIPKFYYRRAYSNGKHEMWISDRPRTGFKVHPAFMRSGVEKPYILVGADKFGAGQTVAQCRTTAQGYGMSIIDIQAWSAIQMLQLIEAANTAGCGTNYRGLNGLYSNPGQWIDGLKIQSGKFYVAGINTNFAVPANGYITNWHYSTAYDWLFLPSAVGGSGNSAIPDYFRSGGNIAVAGFSWPHCACPIYCGYCQNDEHGYCGKGCSCLCNCGYNYGCRNGCHYKGGDGYGCSDSCGRPANGADPGLFAWDLYGTPSAGSVLSTRLLHIP